MRTVIIQMPSREDIYDIVDPLQVIHEHTFGSLLNVNQFQRNICSIWKGSVAGWKSQKSFK